jgi:hypothetical protein
VVGVTADVDRVAKTAATRRNDQRVESILNTLAITYGDRLNLN